MVAVGTVTVGGVQGGFAEMPLILLKNQKWPISTLKSSMTKFDLK